MPVIAWACLMGDPAQVYASPVYYLSAGRALSMVLERAATAPEAGTSSQPRQATLDQAGVQASEMEMLLFDLKMHRILMKS